MAQPWWLSNSNQDMRQGQTERLLRDYVRKWPARSALLWVAVATHEHAGRIRHGSPGAFVFSHLRGYGRNGWNPENKSAKERALHVAILRCDEAAAFHALSLESSYAPENRAKAFKAAEAGVGPPPASAVEDPGSSAAADRAVNEASSCLGDIPGWMLNAPGADAFERNRNRLHATHSLAGRLSIRCMVSKVADTLLGLFRSDAHELQALGITAAWVQAALEAEALGKAPVRLPELPDSFWPSVLAGDYKLASMSLSKQSPRTVEVE
ncbi:MAG: hypothetical protein COA70_13260 [Planctomycetota bacterium]|nr:MAG: hypothetical protein COA70_13260 [Planctomycetota bacterium]